MVQETLNNIIRHARAKLVTVAIEQLNGNITIEIKDDGIGFDPEQLNHAETGIGLKSIQQRCLLINALYNIRSQPGKGTAVQIQINNT